MYLADCSWLAPFGMLLIALVSAPTAFACEQKLKVVELFTSQGCSSCPSADRFLGELATRVDVLPLSEHVDYWDYLGWKDPFASALNTQRQRDYAKLLSNRYVYTPQVVVQGTTQLAGNDRSAILQALDDAPSALVPISLVWREPNHLAVSLGSARANSPAAIWVATFDPVQVTNVATGENSGRELRSFNVVRSLTKVGQWQGKPLEVVADVTVETWKSAACAVFLQEDGTGPILGAARCGP